MKSAIPDDTRDQAENDPAGQLGLDLHDQLFLKEYAKTGVSLKQAAMKAFGKSKKSKHEKPVHYAHSLMHRSSYDRAIMDYWSNLFGCTDALLIRELSKGVIGLKWDGPNGALKLKCILEMMKIKGMAIKDDGALTPTSKVNIEKMQAIIIGDRPLAEVLGSIQKEIPEEELKKMLTDTVRAVSKPSPTTEYSDDELFAKRSEFNQEQGVDEDD